MNGKELMREKLVEQYGSDNVFDTDQVEAEFTIEGSSAPFCYGKRKSTGESVTLEFIHMPRLYWIA